MKKLMLAVMACVALSGCMLNLGGKVLRIGPGNREAQATQQPQPSPARAKQAVEATKEQTPKQKAAVPGTKAREALDALMSSVSKGVPVTSEAIDVMEQHARDAEAILPGGGEYYLHQGAWLRVLLGLTKADGAAVATLLGGTLTTSGDGGHELSVPIKAKADTCYTLVGAFRSWTGAEKVAKRDVEGPASLRAYTVDVQPVSLKTQGFCATTAATHTIRVKSEFAGTTNGLRYAVVEHPRADLPLVVARSIDIEVPDRCDADAWDDALLKPIPGTIGWRERELTLVLNNEVGNGSANCTWLINNGTRLSMGRSCYGDIGSFLAKPAEGSLVFPPFKLERCPNKQDNDNRLPRGETSRKILACEDAITKKYGKAWDEVDARRRAADNRSTASFKYVDTGAEAKAEQLRDAWDKDWARQCEPMFKKARAEAEARYNKRIDAVQANPPVETLGRGQANGGVSRW